MNDEAYHIRERLPGKKKALDLLMAKDPEFITLCEDHDACVDALNYWTESNEPEAETRVDEYHALCRELQEEIMEVLGDFQLGRLD